MMDKQCNNMICLDTKYRLNESLEPMTVREIVRWLQRPCPIGQDPLTSLPSGLDRAALYSIGRILDRETSSLEELTCHADYVKALLDRARVSCNSILNTMQEIWL